jgi:hypothetical protein
VGTVLYSRSGCPEADACTSCFEGLECPFRPPAPRAPVLRPRRRLRRLCGALVDAAELRRRQRRLSCRMNLAKYRPHRPQRLECGRLHGFLAVATAMSYRPSEGGYRPPRQIVPADRPPGNGPFCGAFSPIMVTAVDAVGTFTTVTYVLPIAPRVSFSRGNIDALGKRLHPSLQGRRGRSARCRIRIFPPDDNRDAPVMICWELPNNPGGSVPSSAEAIAAGVME